MPEFRKGKKRSKKTPRQRLADRRGKVLNTVLNLLLIKSGEPKPDSHKATMEIIGSAIGITAKSMCDVASARRNLSKQGIAALAAVVGSAEEFLDLTVLGCDVPGAYTRRKERKTSNE